MSGDPAIAKMTGLEMVDGAAQDVEAARKGPLKHQKSFAAAGMRITFKVNGVNDTLPLFDLVVGSNVDTKRQFAQGSRASVTCCS